MINLPEWKLTLCPPLYDSASTSPIEQTAQVYGKMRELIEDYNRFNEAMTKAFEEYTLKTDKDIENFKKYITCTMQEYINSVDTKLLVLKEELTSYVEETIQKAVDNGFIEYREEEEEIVVGGVS